MVTPSRLAALFAAVVITMFGAVVPAHANSCSGGTCTLDVGHVDGVGVKYVSPHLQLWVGDHTVTPTAERDPATTTLVALPASQTVSTASPACEGGAGHTVWILPQIQNDNLLFLGWSAEPISSGVVDGNKVTLKINAASDITTPAGGGRFCVFAKSGLTTTTIFDSGLSFPQSVDIPVGTTGHRHANWVFTAKGAWQVNFTVTATVGGVAKSVTKTYTFSICPTC
jgi:surface-anchored protein